MSDVLHRYGFQGVEGAPDVEITWTTADQEAAYAEGWTLTADAGAVELAPEVPNAPALFWASPEFYVESRARRGSELHVRAMLLHTFACVDRWEGRYRDLTGQAAAR